MIFSKDKTLFQVVKAAQGRIPVFLDGGVRRGTDVFKALALGASGIFVSTMQPLFFTVAIIPSQVNVKKIYFIFFLLGK